VQVSGGIKRAEMRLCVLNADGTVKRDLGLVGFYHRNPVLNFIGGHLVSWLAARKISQYNKLAKENH
jgi:hypothetical protein